MVNNQPSYWQRSLVELRTECRKRRIVLRGNKTDLIARLIAWDEKNASQVPAEDAPTAPDTIVTTPGGNAFNICGGCNKWDRRCTCANGQNTEKPGKGGTRDSGKKSQASTGAKQNKRDRRYVHRGTFA